MGWVYITALFVFPVMLVFATVSSAVLLGIHFLIRTTLPNFHNSISRFVNPASILWVCFGFWLSFPVLTYLGIYPRGTWTTVVCGFTLNLPDAC